MKRTADLMLYAFAAAVVVLPQMAWVGYIRERCAADPTIGGAACVMYPIVGAILLVVSLLTVAAMGRLQAKWGKS